MSALACVFRGADWGNTVETMWLTTQEAADYLKVPARTLLAWTRAGKVKGFVLSGQRRRVWRFRQIDLDATLEAPAVLNTGRVI